MDPSNLIALTLMHPKFIRQKIPAILKKSKNHPKIQSIDFPIFSLLFTNDPVNDLYGYILLDKCIMRGKYFLCFFRNAGATGGVLILTFLWGNFSWSTVHFIGHVIYEQYGAVV